MEWPFEDPPELGVFVTQRVYDGEAVDIIDHDEDGDWVFLTHNERHTDSGELFEDDVLLLCFEDVVKAHPEAREFADLALGYFAERMADGTWTRGELAPEDV